MSNMRLRIMISAGVGPAEVQEFAQRLCAYFKARIAPFAAPCSVVECPGDAEGRLKHVEMTFPRAGVPDRLVPRSGTHALVHKSAVRPGRKRKRWFVGVVVEEVAGTAAEAKATMNMNDVEILPATKSGGPGGQNVNKTASKVRVRHKPTGICVACGETRSQTQNRNKAIALLAERLQALARQDGRSQKRSKWLQTRTVERGNPVAVYHIDGDHLVKD